jgi:hypothetical protein
MDDVVPPYLAHWLLLSKLVRNTPETAVCSSQQVPDKDKLSFDMTMHDLILHVLCQIYLKSIAGRFASIHPIAVWP